MSKAETIENTESTESTESTENAESVENTESTENSENIESAGKSKGIFRRMEELHRLPLMILAWLLPLFLVKDMVTGILLGAGAVLVFLILEGSRLLFEKFLGSILQTISYLIMVVSLSGIAGILLHLMRMKEMDVPFYCFVLEQIASIYLIKALVNGTGEGKIKREKTEEKAEEKEEKIEEKTGEKNVWETLLPCFAAAVEYMIFLGIFGLLREYAGKWVVSAGLFSGGFLITAGLLLLWKLTKTMPERFSKLPGMMLSTGLIVLVLAGFAGLL